MMQPSLFDMRPPALSVSQITQHIRQLIELDDILQDVWLEGEISNWSPAASGHIYFTLKDSEASIRCVVWRSSVRRLSYRPNGSGEAILAHGRISVYEAAGAYQFYVDDIEAVGLGALYAEFERLKNRLAEEGLFDSERKRPLPETVHRIGVVTSERAAALRDVLNVLSRRYPLAEVILSPCPVQGSDAPPQIVAALERLAGLTPAVDLILLVRGGGSIEDLWAFNDEAVARAVAAAPVPVVSGVGHETDFTIVDFVADERAPTPSAAAELVTPDQAELRRQLTLDRQALAELAGEQLRGLGNMLAQARRQLTRLSPKQQIDNRRQQIDDQLAALRRLTGHQLALRRERLRGAQARLTTLNPKATLARGYAIVQKDRQVIRGITDLRSGDQVTVMLSDGRFGATVDTVETTTNEENEETGK